MDVIFTIKKYSSATGIPNERGLTLLEMLFAIGISAILLGVLAEFLYSGVRMWTKSDRAYQRQHELKYIYQVLQNELTDLVALPNLPGEILTGDGEQIKFWRQTSAGLVQVGYRFDRSELQIMKTEGFWGSTPGETVLFHGVTGWSIEYYQPRTKNWARQWDSGQSREIPALIRFNVTTKTAPLGSIVIPVKVWSKEAENDG